MEGSTIFSLDKLGIHFQIIGNSKVKMEVEVSIDKNIIKKHELDDFISLGISSPSVGQSPFLLNIQRRTSHSMR
jgi:hypothetical protein